MCHAALRHIPRIQDGHSSHHIILRKAKKKIIHSPWRYIFHFINKAERPADNSWLLPASFKAGAVTWMSHFYFIHFFIGMVSTRRSILTLGREDRLRGVCFWGWDPFTHTSHRPSDHTTIRHSSTLSLLSQNWRISRPLGLSEWKEKESRAFTFRLPADEPYEYVWGHKSNASKRVKNRGSMINLIKKLWVLGKTV